MVTEVHFKEGQILKKDDLLAVIDPRPYVAAFLQAQGQLERDEALLKNARIDLVRYQNSYKEHAIPQQELATQQATVDEDEGTVMLDRGNLDAAKVNVDYTRIVSPIDGRVGLRNIDPGNVVPANGTNGLCVITQLQPITVIFVIAEDSIDQVFAQMSTGKPMPVIALDRSKQHTLATGTLLTVDNQVNTTTGTVRARATFPNTHNELFPNQFVNARLLVKTLTGVNLVPQAAIQHNNDIAFVYVVQPDNSVQSRNVKILAINSSPTASTSCKTARKWRSARRRRRRRTRRRRRPDESVPAVHPASDRDLAADGGDSAGRNHRIPAIADCGTARSRLSDDAGHDLLPRGERRCRGDRHHRTAGAATG
jgi:multidrug efflux system membrane fusion protein